MASGESRMVGGLQNHNVPVVLNEILRTPSNNGNASRITEELGSPKIPTMSPPKFDYHYPHQTTNLFVNEKQNNERYDSNGKPGQAKKFS